MSDHDPPSATRSNAFAPQHRVSLACLACRSRHLKCNATKPSCSRCVADGVPCTYARSRRGGRRRVRQPDQEQSEKFALPPVIAPESAVISTAVPSYYLDMGIDDQTLLLTPSTSESGNGSATNGLSGLSSIPTTTPTRPFDSSEFSSELIDDYYNFFHPGHCCVLPQWSLEKRWAQNPTIWTPLLYVMQYIGSLYNDQASSDRLEELAMSALPLDQATFDTPHTIQAALLFAIASYWSDHIEYGTELMKRVVQSALTLQMHHSECAVHYGQGDAVLEESWRRTWWQLYYTHACITATAHTLPHMLSGLKMTCHLPSEEASYEAGEIPTPRTLRDYDMREFLPQDDPGFSSFAHMIGILRAIDLVLSENLSLEQNRGRICAEIDIGLSAWQALLPPAKRKHLQTGQTVDVHLFAAHMMIIAYVVDFHRAVSDLSYSSIESVARCTPPAPPAKPRPGEVEDTSFHTNKVLSAIRRMGDLLPLPASLHMMTPFFTCIIATVTVAHLSACRYIHRDRTLQLERERVRLSMGALRMLGEHWPLGRRTYDEMGIIAREILCLSDRDISVAQRELEGAGSPRGLSPLCLDMFIGSGIPDIPFFEM